MLRLEAEVKSLHVAVDQIQVALASPDLNKLSLREQLSQRQVLIPVVTLYKQISKPCLPLTLSLISSSLL